MTDHPSPTVEEALKPCPFCGSSPSLSHLGVATIIRCENAVCGASGVAARRSRQRGDGGKQDAADACAITAWNTRPQIEAQGGEPVGWRPTCDLCHKALTEPGSLLFGAPNDEGLSKKTHICATCALTRPDPSLGNREAVAFKLLEIESGIETAKAVRQNNAGRWAQNLERADKVLSVIALSPPSLGMEGVRELFKVREAIKPFADFAPQGRFVPDDQAITMGSPLARRQLTMGDCYRAADFLASISTPSGEV